MFGRTFACKASMSGLPLLFFARLSQKGSNSQGFMKVAEALARDPADRRLRLKVFPPNPATLPLL